MIRFGGGKLGNGRLRSNSAEAGGDAVWLTPAGRIATASERQIFRFQLAVLEPARTSFRIVSGNLPNTLFLNQTTGLITGATPDVSFGVNFFFTIAAITTTGVEVPRTFSILVQGINDPPVWLAPETRLEYQEDRVGPIIFGLRAEDDDTVEGIFLAGGSLPPGFGYNEAIRLMQGGIPRRRGTPLDVGEDASFVFTMRAADGAGLFTDRQFTMVFRNVNEPPEIITRNSGILLDRGPSDVIDFQFAAKDDEPVDRLVWSGQSLPPGLSISPEGRLIGIVPNPIPRDVIHTFVVSVADRQGLVDTSPFRIRYSRPNSPPVWITPNGSVGTYDEGRSFAITLRASDDWQLAAFRLQQDSPALPTGLRLDASTGVLGGLIAFTNVDENESPRDFSFVVEAVDDRGLSTPQTFQITVRHVPEPVDDLPPVWNVANSNLGTVFEGVPFSARTLRAEDDFGVALYRIADGSGLPPGLTLIDPIAGVLGGIADYSATEFSQSPRDFSFVAEAIDVSGQVTPHTFSIGVIHVRNPQNPAEANTNSPPSWRTAPFLGTFWTGAFWEPMVLEWLDDDPINAIVSLDVAALPTFITPVISAASLPMAIGLFGTFPTEAPNPLNTISFSAMVRDSDGLEAAQSFTFVYGPDALTPDEQLEKSLIEACISTNLPVGIATLPSGAVLLDRKPEGFSVTYDLSITNCSTLPITVTLSGETPGLSLTLTDDYELGGTLSRIIPEVEGESRSFTFRLRAVDRFAAVERTYEYIVDGVANEPPSWPDPFPGFFNIRQGRDAILRIPILDDEPNVIFSIVNEPITAYGRLTDFLTFSSAGVFVGAVPNFPVPAATFVLDIVAQDALGVALPPQRVEVRAKINEAPEWQTQHTLPPIFEGFLFRQDLVAVDDFTRVIYTPVPPLLPAEYALTTGGDAISLFGSLGAVAEDSAFTFAIEARDVEGLSSRRTFIQPIVSTGSGPMWLTPAGAIGTITGASIVEDAALTVSALRAVTYIVAPLSSLPSGLALDEITGEITGVAPDNRVLTTYSFDLRALDVVGEFQDRSFSIILNPRVNTPPTFLVPQAPTILMPLLIAPDPYIVPLFVEDDVPGTQIQFVSGDLPPGFTLDTVTSSLRGTVIPTTIAATDYTFVARAIDSDGEATTGTFVARVLRQDDPPVWQTPINLGSFIVGQTVRATLVATDDYGPLRYILKDGSLPSAVSLTSDGTIFGVMPRTLPRDDINEFVWNFTVGVEDARNPPVNRAFRVTGLRTNPIPVWQTPPGALISVTERQPYPDVQLVATDDSNEVTYEIIGGALPDGFSMNPSGLITGTAPEVGDTETFYFTVRATDPQGLGANRSFSITVFSTNEPPVWVTSPDLGTYSALIPLNITLLATDLSSVRYVLRSGALPDGISLNSRTGVISGTASQPVAESEQFPFRIEARDVPEIGSREPVGVAPRDFILVIRQANGVPVWQTPAGNQGTFAEAASVSFTLLAQADFGIVSYQLATPPTPPAWLSIDGDRVVGVAPSIASDQVVSFAVNAIANDIATRASFSLTLRNAPTWLTTSLPSVGETESYTASVVALQAEGYSLIAGFLPPGLVFSSTGVISGRLLNTVLEPTNYPLTIRADRPPTSSIRTFVLQAVPSPPVFLTAPNLGTFLEDQVVTATLIATTPVSMINRYELVLGALPLGMQLNELSGVVSGTVASNAGPQIYTFTVDAIDERGFRGRREFRAAVSDVTFAVVWNTEEGSLGTFFVGAEADVRLLSSYQAIITPP